MEFFPYFLKGVKKIPIGYKVKSLYNCHIEWDGKLYVFHLSEIEKFERDNYINHNLENDALPMHSIQEPSFYQQEITELEAQLATLQKENAELKEKLVESGTQFQDSALADFFATYPIIHRIFKRHKEGKNIDDIVMELTGGINKLATAVLTGWLLQPDLNTEA